MRCLNIEVRVGTKISGNGTTAFRVQIGDVLFYQFLEGIGLHSAKSKTLGALKIPKKYFRDFLRGYFDGDGTSYSFFDPVFPNSFRFYMSFMSASSVFLHWLREMIEIHAGVRGFINRQTNPEYMQLRFAKEKSVQLARYIYYNTDSPSLDRKRLKIEETLRIIGS